MKKESSRGTEMTLSMLLVAFVVLKLCGVIDWSWIWVLSPVWMPIALALIVVGVALIFSKDKKKERSNT